MKKKRLRRKHFLVGGPPFCDTLLTLVVGGRKDGADSVCSFRSVSAGVCCSTGACDRSCSYCHSPRRKINGLEDRISVHDRDPPFAPPTARSKPGVLELWRLYCAGEACYPSDTCRTEPPRLAVE